MKELISYTFENGEIDIQVDQDNETIWLDKNRIAQLYDIDRSGISRHISKILSDGELDTESNVQKMHIANSDKPVDFYSLDIILAVGYRVNSKIAVQFRKWATQRLKDYLVQGYAINERCLNEKQSQLLQLKNSISLLSRTIETQAQNLDEARQLARLMTDFAGGLDLLDNFDHKKLDVVGKTKKEAVIIGRDEFLTVINKMKSEFESDVFANPKDDSFDSSINQIYQTFDGKDCYPSLEEKAAMLLYFLVKNYSFTDENERIGAACFLYFLNKNKMLYNKAGVVLDNNTLFALTLLIAESKPEEKDTMKHVIVSMLNKGK